MGGMKTIKFSHDYPKLYGQKTAQLVYAKRIDIDEDTPKELLEYDTRYIGPAGTVDHFPLPEGEYIQLIFIGDKRIPFSTIRKTVTELGRDNVEYYGRAVGECFNIEIIKRGGY